MSQKHRWTLLLSGWLVFQVFQAGCQTIYEFDNVSLGEPKTRLPRPKEKSQFVRAVFADLGNRAPAVNEYVVKDANGAELYRFPLDEPAFLDQILDDLADPTPLRSLIAAGLATSEAARLPTKAAVKDPGAFVQEQFRRLLGRDPTTYERSHFVREWMTDPEVTPVTVVRALVSSREYQSL